MVYNSVNTFRKLLGTNTAIVAHQIMRVNYHEDLVVQVDRIIRIVNTVDRVIDEIQVVQRMKVHVVVAILVIESHLVEDHQEN